MPVTRSETPESEELRQQKRMKPGGGAFIPNGKLHENVMDPSVDWLNRMLAKQMSLSETIALKPDGSLNPESTAELPRPVLINSLMDMELTQNGLMKACKEIADKHPDLEFSFKLDDVKHTLTYTVTKGMEGANNLAESMKEKENSGHQPDEKIADSGIPIFVSRDMEQQLADFGWNKEQRKYLDPKDAFRILKEGKSRKQSEIDQEALRKVREELSRTG